MGQESPKPHKDKNPWDKKPYSVRRKYYVLQIAFVFLCLFLPLAQLVDCRKQYQCILISPDLTCSNDTVVQYPLYSSEFKSNYQESQNEQHFTCDDNYNHLYRFSCPIINTTRTRIALIQLRLRRCTMRKHDFHNAWCLVCNDCSQSPVQILSDFMQHWQHRSKNRAKDAQVCNFIACPSYSLRGGGIPTKPAASSTSFAFSTLRPYIDTSVCKTDLYKFKDKFVFAFVGNYALSDLQTELYLDEHTIVCSLPAPGIVSKMTRSVLHELFSQHGIPFRNHKIAELRSKMNDHICQSCVHKFCVFRLKQKGKATKPVFNMSPKVDGKKAPAMVGNCSFPPDPPSRSLLEAIVNGWSKDMRDATRERGCAVCARLTNDLDLFDLDSVDFDLGLLHPQQAGTTRLERIAISDPVKEIEGPLLENNCHNICKDCAKCLTKAKPEIPINALANGLWLGEVPKELANLSFAEKMLIARVRHNKCIVRVSSGMHKMRANVIMFDAPIPKVYDILPPPRDELDEVLAFIFVGPSNPTPEELRRVPLLVSRNKVARALEWLKLNHADYQDLTISYENLKTYPENEPPVFVKTQIWDGKSNKDPEATAVYDNEDEDGVEEGDCPFVVQGLTGEQLGSMNAKGLAAAALKHLKEGNKVLAVGHAPEPESMYKNPQLYPKMFPWLFPYGLGGIGNNKQTRPLSEPEWKKHLLMYYDKRFQLDHYFPLVAFNHVKVPVVDFL